MNRQIRRGVFETNSSSVHSITMCSDDEYKEWENGDAYMQRYGSKIQTREEIIKEFSIKIVPTFILIDPNGNIVNARAPRPSEAKLIDLLNSLKI